MTEKTAKPKAFQCYLDNITVLEHLTDSEAGQLWKMLYHLAVHDERIDTDDPLVSMAFDMMANKLERDFAAYANRVEINRVNGKKKGASSGKKTEAKESEAKETEAKGSEAKETEAKGSDGYRSPANGSEAKRQVDVASETSQYKDKDKNKYKDKYEDEDEDKNKYEYKDEDERKKASAKADAAADVVSLFSSYFPSMPTGAVSEELVRRASRALGDTGFEGFFKRVSQSDFLTGRNGKWMGCTLAWLLREDTINKVLGGAYSDRKAPEKPRQKPSYDINELEKLDTLDFMDGDDWEELMWNSV